MLEINKQFKNLSGFMCLVFDLNNKNKSDYLCGKILSDSFLFYLENLFLNCKLKFN